MQNQNGRAQSKALILFVVLVVVIAGILLIDRNESASNRVKHNHISRLNSLKVALARANKIVHEQSLSEGEGEGKASVLFKGVPIGTFNGYISSKTEDLRNALGHIYSGKQSITPATVNWQFQRLRNSSDGVSQVKIFEPSIKKENCYLVYSQAGTETTVAEPSSEIVDSGC